MKLAQPRRTRLGALALTVGAASLLGCVERVEPNPEPQPQVGVVTATQSIDDLAQMCGLDVNCEAAGVLEGNASISGIASVDAFFGAVVKFGDVAASVSGGIDAEIDAIRGDFGIAADADLSTELQAQISANLEGDLDIQVEPARCAVDAMATVQAQAKCEGEVSPGSVEVECEGSCEVEASANVQCDASAELRCTVTAPSVACDGECSGSCEVDAMASLGGECSGTCKGGCNGTCELMNAQGECQGKCEGTCMGNCEFEVAASGEVNCEGTCKGECTATPPDGNCEGGIRAECKAQAGAMVMCSGRCDGKVEPPMASVECQASAKAEASLNVECTPPRVAVNYTLKAGVNAEVQARFEAALKTLASARLPALKAKLAKADLVIDAAADLGASADGAIKGAADAVGSGNAKAFFGAKCAIGQIGAVGMVLGDASAQLQASVQAAGEVGTGLGV